MSPAIRRLPSGKWNAQVRLPNGKRRSFSDPLRKVVVERARDLEAQISRGTWRDPRASKITVGEWCERWKAARVVESSTAATDEQWLRLYVLPKWKDWPLGVVTRMEVRGWVAELLARPLAPSTVGRAVALLTSMYAAALEEDPPLVAGNPALRIPVGRSEPRLRWLTHKQVDDVVAKLTEPWSTLALVQAWCGLRWEEVAALHVGRVDFLRGRLRVVEVWSPDHKSPDGHGHLGVRAYPKSRKSRREVPVPPWLLKRLSVAAQGSGLDDLMWSRADGRVVAYGTWWDAWKRALERAGVEHVNPHALRHTAASWLVQAGVPLYDVQQLLGHERFTTTQQYAHLAPDAHGRVEEAWSAMPRRTGAAQGTETGG